MIKDYIMRLSVVFVWALFLIYTVALLIQWLPIVQEAFLASNTLMYIFIILLIGYVTLVYGLYPLPLPRLRRTLLIIGLALIMIGHYILKDDPANYVYFADFTKILGVLLFILWPAWLLISDRVKKKKAASKIEVIEV
jgi:peptidoglycan/LPS O-acetylase OafA/YrhL